MAGVRQDRRRVVIEAARPVVESGRFAAKACAGVPLEISADVFAHGHDRVLAWVRWGRPQAPQAWREARLSHDINDRFSGWITPRRLGDLAFEIVAAVDDWGSWLHGAGAKLAARQTIDLDLEEGALLALGRIRTGINAADRRALRALAAVLRNASLAPRARLREAATQRSGRLLERTLDRSGATVEGPHPVLVERELAGFSAWYEMFPRSEGAEPPRSGTLYTASRRLPSIAQMGFDIVYLPPIHPIGTVNRKGPGNSLAAGPDDVGSPWAIGSAGGGHTAINSDLGTLQDFDSFVGGAHALGLEVALDYALQCAPDHPWVTEHPEWFATRPDGSVRYAENPPKRYEDIYPIDFETRDWRRLWNALRDVLLFWCGHGVSVFRVDNPHTKPLHFWEWVISEVRRRHPGTIFLAEAFTRPKVMHRLAKAGFSQSYTYFTWRTAKWELEEYLGELSTPPGVDYFRPCFWPNTPDILHASLQYGGPAAFRLRLILAAFGAASWGMYSGYELAENVAVREGSEEYLNSEKYELRPRDFGRADSLAPLVGRVNEVRRVHRGAMTQMARLHLHHIDNDALICFSRSSPGNEDVLLVIVNLDPHAAQDGSTWLDLEALGIPPNRPYEAHDELTDTTYVWHGPRNYVRLDPGHQAGHVLHLRKR